MHVTLVTYGSRGDTQPFIALGVGLLRAGHTVHLAAPERFAAQAASYGLAFTPLPGDVEAMTRTLVEEAGASVPRLLSVMIRATLEVVGGVTEGVYRATAGADVVVHSFLTAASGHSAARLRGARDISAQVFPFFAPTGVFPQISARELPLGPAYNRLTHRLSSSVIRLVTTWSYNLSQWGRHNPLAPLRWPDVGGRTPVLQAYSPLIVPRPPDWPASIIQTGYWFLDEGARYTPSAALATFLERGAPPVVIGTGSIGGAQARRLLETSVSALHLAGRRGVLLSGWVGDADLEALPGYGEQFIVLREAPHDWLYPRASVVVHHGGAGTTGAALRAGVPAVVTPFIADQFFWARRAHRLGVGPAPLPAAQLSPEMLADAIRRAEDPTIRRRAAAVGACVRAEDGIGAAIRAIEALGGVYR
ncbi:MAG: glycosyltransferase [Chloroflexi bacterium OHK40]